MSLRPFSELFPPKVLLQKKALRTTHLENTLSWVDSFAFQRKQKRKKFSPPSSKFKRTVINVFQFSSGQQKQSPGNRVSIIFRRIAKKSHLNSSGLRCIFMKSRGSSSAEEHVPDSSILKPRFSSEQPFEQIGIANRPDGGLRQLSWSPPVTCWSFERSKEAIGISRRSPGQKPFKTLREKFKKSFQVTKAGRTVFSNAECILNRQLRSAFPKKKNGFDETKPKICDH